jgi:hypothetical protein
MTAADPLAVARSALWGCVVGVRVLARRGTELADHLLDLVTSRAAERGALTTALPASGPPTEIEDAKFYPGSDGDTPPPPDGGGHELPGAYGREQLILLARDPWTLFAYWEIAPGTRVATLRALGAEAGAAREVLRVYDVTFVTPTGDQAWLAFDIELPARASSAYATVARPGASYSVQIGLRTQTNRFLPMARSNTVTLPPAAPSPDTTVRWMQVLAGTPAPVLAEANAGREARPATGAPGVVPAAPAR